MIYGFCVDENRLNNLIKDENVLIFIENPWPRIIFTVGTFVLGQQKVGLAGF